MSRRCFASLVALTVALAVLTGAPPPAAGQPAENAANRAAAPRTAWGAPEWDFRTLTPLERPSELAGKTVLTEEEAAEFEAVTLDRRNNDRRSSARSPGSGTASARQPSMTATVAS